MRNIKPGDIFAKWIVLALADKGRSGSAWTCKCACGETKRVLGYNLISGHSTGCKSCGHLSVGNKNRRHAASHSSLYTRWVSMLQRCHNAANKSFGRYGARGIFVIDHWRISFEAFQAWAVTSGYRPNLQLDRIDNEGPYAPTNCRWVTVRENQNNKRKTIFVDVGDGRRMPLQFAAELFGINEATLRVRIKNGWDHKLALVPPKRRLKELEVK